MHRKVRSLIRCSITILLSSSGFAASNGPDGLVEAAKNQDATAVRTLLQQHADATATDHDGATALHWAAHWDQSEIADLLIRAGARINAANDLGVTPLYLACTVGSAAMVERLLAAGANPNLVAVTGVSPLMMAARSGSAEAVRALLVHGANPNVKESSRGQTALMWAVAESHPNVVRLLVEHGADVAARSDSSDLLVNISRGVGQDNQGISKLIRVGGSTALLFAARQGCIECARYLLTGGANVNDTAPDGNSALTLAAHSGEGAFAEFLLEKGANPNPEGAGYTALHAAVLRGDVDLIRALLQHGADPGARIESGTSIRNKAPSFALPATLIGATAFLEAAKFADADAMRVLAEGGTNLKLTANDGTTPIMAASSATHRTIGDSGKDNAVDEIHAMNAVKIAIGLGCDVQQADQAGNTAAHIAASRGYANLVQLLADNGAGPEVKNKRGQTASALLRAAAGHSSEKVKVNPDVQTNMYRRIDDHTYEVLSKKNGKVIGTSLVVISPDGRASTQTQTGNTLHR